MKLQASKGYMLKHQWHPFP